MPINEEEKHKIGWLLKRLVSAEDYSRPYFERAKRYYRLIGLLVLLTRKTGLTSIR